MALIQTAFAKTNSFTLSVSFTNNIAAGNTVIVCIASGSSVYPTTVSPASGGDTYSQEADDSAGNTSIWAVISSAGGYKQVNIANPSSGFDPLEAWIYEVSQITAADQVTSGYSGSAGTSFSSGATGTTGQASEFVVAVGAGIAGSAVTAAGPSSPWTNLAAQAAEKVSGATYWGAVSGYQAVSSTGTFTYSGTLSPSCSQQSACVVTFKMTPPVTPVSEADAGGAADQVTAQITSIPVRLITAPRRPAGPPPPPIRAQVLTVPQGSAMPHDAAGASESMTAGAVTVPLADRAGAADAVSGGIRSLDAAGAAESASAAVTVTFSAAALTPILDEGGSPVLDEGGAEVDDESGGAAAADAAGAAEVLTLTGAAAVSLADIAAAADASRASGLVQPDAAGAADKLTASVTVAFADRAAGADVIGQEPAIGASGGATRPCAMPGTSQVAVAPPGSSNWYLLGSYGQITALTYSYTCPGGCDSMTCTLMVPASYRNQIMDPGWQVRVYRGGHIVWAGRMDEPVPVASSGWNFTAVGNGMRGADFLAIYSDTWPAGQPDESINNAIARGLPWVNPGVGQPAGAWFGQAVDSGASTITALLTLLTTRGGLTWYVNSQPGGAPGDDLSVFPLPTVPNRLLISTTPVPRTLGGDINTIYLRYEISADTTGTASDGSSTSVPAVYGLAVAQNAASVAMHQELETFVDLSDAGVMTALQAEEVGQAILQVYQRASFAGPFVGNYGALMNMGGTPVDPGTDQAGSVVRLVLTDFGYGGELTPGAPIQFIVGSYSWDDFAQTFTLSALNTLDQSITGMLSMESTILSPVTVAST